MVSETCDSQFLARRVDGSLAFLHAHQWVGLKIFVILFASDAFQQAAHIRNHRDATNLPILRASDRIALDSDFAFLEVTMMAANAGRLTFAATAIGKELYEVATFTAPPTVGLADCGYQFAELILTRKAQELLPNLLPLDVNGWIVVTSAGFNGNIQHQFERTDSVVKSRWAGLLSETSRPSEAI